MFWFCQQARATRKLSKIEVGSKPKTEVCCLEESMRWWAGERLRGRAVRTHRRLFDLKFVPTPVTIAYIPAHLAQKLHCALSISVVVRGWHLLLVNFDFFSSRPCLSHNGNDHLCMICALFLIWPFHRTLFRFLSTGDSNGETDGFRFAGSTRRPHTPKQNRRYYLLPSLA